ncbi:MAG: hypothetical protein KGI70_01360 [Patescibacteria group bacterium]|nr:hypothetical protein [Patescibacteria group bacterium]
MNRIPTYVWWILGAVVVGAAVLLGVLSSMGRSSPAQQQNSSFGSGAQSGGTVGTVNEQPGSANIPTASNSTDRIFKLSGGPVAAVVSIETLHPTTTLARFVMQDSGHVFDLMLDSQGALPKAVSNTTIPGIERALFAHGGTQALLQYFDGGTIKTVSVGLAIPGATTSAPTRLQFLPDNVLDVALSPSGVQAAYLLRTNAGADGYIANYDGTSPKKLFSLPLTQVLLSWPAAGTLLVGTNSAAGVPGMLFSVDAKAGTVRSLLYAPGLTGAGAPDFSEVVYQTDAGGGPITYAHNTKTGRDTELSFDPSPERCVWSPANTLWCAAALTYTTGSFLDLWHIGLIAPMDSIVSYDVSMRTTLTTPGKDGGDPASIASVALSPDGRYLLYITSGDRALWAVRITQ